MATMKETRLRGVRGSRIILSGGLACLLLLAAGPGRADMVYLKNGRQIEGVIDREASNERIVTIHTATSTLRLPRANIKQIESDEDRSFSEVSGDLAASEGDYDRALSLYEKALAYEPDNERLKRKVEEVGKFRDTQTYQQHSTAFATIEQNIEGGNFEAAVQRATGLLEQVRDAQGRRICQELIARAHIGLARRLRDRVAYLEAENHYREAIQAHPEGARATLELADMLQLSPARKTQAIPLYEKGIELARAETTLYDEERLLEYRFQLAKLYFDEKDFQQATEIFLAVTRADRQFRFTQGIDLAIEAYTKILADPEQVAAEAVITNLQSIIELRENDRRPYLLLGRLYFEAEDWQRARDIFRVALGKSPPDLQDRAYQDMIYYLGVSERNLGQLDEAAVTLQTLLTQGLANYESLCELGEIRLEQGMPDIATTIFDQAQSRDPERYRAYFGLGLAHIKLGLFDAARRHLFEVVEKDSDNARALLALADTYRQEEKWRQTETEAKKIVDLIEEQVAKDGTPNEEQKKILAEAMTMMGEANLKQKNTNRSRELFEKSIENVPDYAPALNGIGESYQMDGRHQEALDYFKKSIEADEDNPNYYLSLAVHLHNNFKDTVGALPNYLEYVRLGGKDPNVYVWIEECGGTVPENI